MVVSALVVVGALILRLAERLSDRNRRWATKEMRRPQSGARSRRPSHPRRWQVTDCWSPTERHTKYARPT